MINYVLEHFSWLAGWLEAGWLAGWLAGYLATAFLIG